MQSPSDAQVARSVAAGGPDAAEHEDALCRRFLNRARVYGLKHLRFDVTAAEDLAQEVIMIVLEALRAGKVQNLDRIDRFILGTCRNVAHSMRRRAQKTVDTSRRLSKELGDAVTAPWDFVVTRTVAECLARLTQRESRVLMLLIQEGATAHEVADALDTTPGNVRVIHHRAIARVRQCLERTSEATA